MTSCVCVTAKDGSKVITVLATEGHGPDTSRQVSYTDTKVIGNGSFGVVYQAKLCESGDLVAIKKVLQDKRFKVSCVSSCGKSTVSDHCMLNKHALRHCNGPIW